MEDDFDKKFKNEFNNSKNWNNNNNPNNESNETKGEEEFQGRLFDNNSVNKNSMKYQSFEENIDGRVNNNINYNNNNPNTYSYNNNNNNIQISQKNSNNIVSNSNNNINSDNDTPVHRRKTNEEKLFFFKFLNYNTKIEMHYDQFALMIYWTSILDIVLFLISLFFIGFTSSLVFVLIVHVARGVVGFCLIKNMPLTHQVIDNLNGFEDDSLEIISNKLTIEFKKQLNLTEEKLKTCLVMYFISCILCLIIDVIGVMLVITRLNAKEDTGLFFFLLIVMIVLLGKIMLFYNNLFIKILLGCYFSYVFELFWLDEWS
jgi:hypothetical protein